jgi:16S rRNA (uracil1498-N3)-methyltransferase
MNIGDIFFVQNSSSERYKVRIDDRDKNSMRAVIMQEIDNPGKKSPISLAVAMPNKRDKAELIAQKLTEIGIHSLVFWSAERSVIKKPNPKKMERIYKIVKEATEQSWSWYMPSVQFIDNIGDFCYEKHCIVFDTTDEIICSSVSK